MYESVLVDRWLQSSVEESFDISNESISNDNILRFTHKNHQLNLGYIDYKTDCYDVFISKLKLNEDFLLSGLERALIGKLVKAFHSEGKKNIVFNKNCDVNIDLVNELNFKENSDTYYLNINRYKLG
ncbi:hypothetical protein UA32_11915 [Photobacterium angustum]|uniref:Uncharacterized protein n=2 Tax=Photobacterium angustum TaxID=661 RepID=A0ABX5GYT2_PHOAN|nr:hypothetical protein [Photobacterium angustum]KJG37664.1 hypothetical protein UA32_11915 [Photobacterium angustum]PSX01666.1 hypothetical protein C0W27_22010 [Photobacterium angustum]